MTVAADTLSREEVALLMRDEEARAIERPSDLYVPGSADRYPDEADRYQLQFHRSTHIYRLLVLGNGAGKSTTAGVEADLWLQHKHPYQPTPTWPIQAIWICQKFQQFDEQRPQFENRCLTAGFDWNDTDHRYTWPNGSTMTVFSDEGNWKGAQGIPADIVFVDEECNPRLWLELRMRRRGDKKTRYVISATATQGKRWMYKDIYVPWLQHHVDQGLAEEQAMRMQSHKRYWVWPRGGILDNPGCTEEDEEEYKESVRNLPPAEQAARLRGGFHDFNASAVFNQEAVAEMEATNAKALARARAKHADLKELGVTGQLVDTKGVKPDVIKIGKQWFDMKAFPLARQRFKFIESTLWEGGRLTIFERPKLDAFYVMGVDSAQGLQTGDFDAAVVCRGEGERLVQVAAAVGRWGQTIAPALFAMLGWYFNEALAVGEANSMGLGNMQLMWKLGYTYQYFREQKQDAKVSPKTDRLGYWKGSPVPIQRLQQVLAPREAGTIRRAPSQFVVRDAETLAQIRDYQWRPRSSAKGLEEVHDDELVMGAPSGQHDDLVSASAGCVIGWAELPRFERPGAIIKTGTAADLLGHAEEHENEKPSGPYSFARK